MDFALLSITTKSKKINETPRNTLSFFKFHILVQHTNPAVNVNDNNFYIPKIPFLAKKNHFHRSKLHKPCFSFHAPGSTKKVTGTSCLLFMVSEVDNFKIQLENFFYFLRTDFWEASGLCVLITKTNTKFLNLGAVEKNIVCIG